MDKPIYMGCECLNCGRSVDCNHPEPRYCPYCDPGNEKRGRLRSNLPAIQSISTHTEEGRKVIAALAKMFKPGGWRWFKD